MVNIVRFRELPCLFKPIMLIVLFVLFILYCASWWASPWSWFICVFQFVAVVGITVGLALEMDVRLTSVWLLLEMAVSGVFFVAGVITLILHLRWLIVYHKAIVGVEGIMVVILTALHALNGYMIFKIWRGMGSATGTSGFGVQPGNTGTMYPGAGNVPPPTAAAPTSGAVYPGASPPYPSAVPPEATFPSTTPSPPQQPVW